ncbi:MAG: glycosyltransferase family 4 protein [Leptothrix sp. (in: b-proteobacteria)]
MPSIVFIVPELLPVPPTEGGAVEHWVHEVSQRLAQRGFRVTVVSRPADAPGDPAITYLGVPWTAAGRTWLRLKQRSSRRNPLRALAKLAGVFGYALGVRRALRGLDADLVYLHNDPLLAALLPRRNGQKQVLHLHNDHLSLPAFKPLLTPLLARTDLVLCVSDFIRDRVRRACPAHAATVHTVLNATDPERFRPRSTRTPDPAAAFDCTLTQFLYVGRLTADKGVHVLIDAFARLHQAHPLTRLTLAGSSFYAHAPRTAYEGQLAAQAAPLGDAVRFSGFVPHARLSPMYAEADVVVVPSVWQEPFGLVAAEAMASGTCVIASAVGGLPELVTHNRTGLLVAPGDAAALAAAMTRVLLDAALRQRLGQAARQAVLAHFSYPRLAGELATWLEGLVRPSTRVAHPQFGARHTG